MRLGERAQSSRVRSRPAEARAAVFDAERIIDHTTFEQPHRCATGVEFAIVNGVVVLDRGQHTHARPGQILYGPGRAGSRRLGAAARGRGAPGR
jgi:N-acyl-D-aspartate/D-glutamate deacylase